MDAFRYYLALLVVMGVPGALAFWFSIHPFVGFWRRVGVRPAYIFHFGLLLLVAGAVFRLRARLLESEFGTQPILIAVALGVYALAFAVAWQRRKDLSKQQLLGLPELAPDRADNRLVTEGVYSRVRHPRYIELTLFLVGHALWTNYAAVYAALVLWLAAVPAIIWMEERELRGRFGKEYELYCARVPRLIPKL